MKKLKDLSDKSLTSRVLDHEAYGTNIQQIFQRVKEATMSFFVSTIMFIQGDVFKLVVTSWKWRSALSKRRVKYATTPR